MAITRIQIVEYGFIGLLTIVVARLFYWQIFAGNTLQAIAQTQHQSVIEIPASRGKILASDGYPLVNNQPAYISNPTPCPAPVHHPPPHPLIRS